MEKIYPAKITRPNALNTVARPRLLHRLDEAARKPLLWITSPAGSGKTALVSSYVQERGRPIGGDPLGRGQWHNQPGDSAER